MFTETSNVWLFFAAGFMLCFIIQMIGYAVYCSQRDAEDVDMRLLLIIHTIVDGSLNCVKVRVTDQAHAQQELNKYMFHMIESAIVRNPKCHNRIVAKMDASGRLMGV